VNPGEGVGYPFISSRIPPGPGTWRDFPFFRPLHGPGPDRAWEKAFAIQGLKFAQVKNCGT